MPVESQSDIEQRLGAAIGRRIERVRELARLNRAQMAALMLLPAHQVRPVERGERMLRIAEAFAPCSILGVSPAWLLMGVGEMWVDDRWRTSRFDGMDPATLAVFVAAHLKMPE